VTWNGVNSDTFCVTFNSDMSSEAHVGHRISAANRRTSSLTSDDLCYPGLSSEVKSHLWNMAVRPILTYGCHSVYTS
jgi:hypothetical protein